MKKHIDIAKEIVGYSGANDRPIGDKYAVMAWLSNIADRYYADDILMEFNAPKDMPMYGTPWRGKQELLARVRQGLDLFEQSYDGPVQIIDGGDTIVTLGYQNFFVKKSGEVIKSSMFLWAHDFRNGRVWRCRALHDFSSAGLGAVLKSDLDPVLHL